jgi:two-component system chemotaxis response regulator CheY
MTTILVVDDDRGIRALHTRYIMQAIPDIEILHASNGREALKLVERYSPHFIVSDYSMPEMDGFEMLKALKSNPKWSAIPVIIVTGVDSMASGEMLRGGGAGNVLPKPVRPEQLVEEIRRVLSKL